MENEPVSEVTFKFSSDLCICCHFTGFSSEQTPPVVVGRISYLEEDLLRYVPEDDDWVAVVRDVPFGTEDSLYSGNQGMVELIVPNGSWIRIGNNTQIQAIGKGAYYEEP